MSKFIAAPKYHPLSQGRFQLQQLNNLAPRITYSIKNPILSIAADQKYRNSHWGTLTIFFNNLWTNINSPLQHQQYTDQQNQQILGPYAIVDEPIITKNKFINKVNSNITLNLITKYIPIITKVEECIKELAGVGALIAAGNQT